MRWKPTAKSYVADRNAKAATPAGRERGEPNDPEEIDLAGSVLRLPA
jgi:hypothetical protein